MKKPVKIPTGQSRAGSPGLSSPRGTISYVDEKWTRNMLNDVQAKLNPGLLAAMEKESPEYAAIFRDTVIPANKANLFPNLVPIMQSVINQVCDHQVAHAVNRICAAGLAAEKQKVEARRLISRPGDSRVTIDLNVTALQGGTVTKVFEKDSKGNITKMITQPLHEDT